MKIDAKRIARAERWLSRARNLDKEVNALLRAKMEERDRLSTITTSTADVRVRSSGDLHKFDRLIELENKIDEIIDRELAVKQEIIELIDKVQNRVYKTLLTDRYIRFLTWERIAVDMHYSYQHVADRLRIKALSVVADLLDKM